MSTSSGRALLLLLLCVSPALAAPPQPEPDEPYSQRLQAVVELGHKFPGQMDWARHDLRDLGLFAGIYLISKWQVDSGRDQIPIWNRINRSLTVVPWLYAQEFIANPALPPDQSPYVLANPTRDAVNAPVKQAETCSAWKAYFKLETSVRTDLASGNLLRRLRGAWISRTNLRDLLWRAHTLSIRHTIWQYLDEFQHSGLPEAEMSYFRGWTRWVYTVEKLGLRSTVGFTRPLLDCLMPVCAPLGQNTCSSTHQNLASRAFIDLMIRNGRAPFGPADFGDRRR